MPQPSESTPTGRPADPVQAREASRLLDVLFSALSRQDGPELLLAICAGTVTGAALAAKLGRTREDVSKLAKRLQQGGLIEARREGVWVRFSPSCTGFDRLADWMEGLAPIGPDLELQKLEMEQQRRRTRSLKTATARRLLKHAYGSAGCTQIELARACGGLSQSVTSRTLARLVRGGLLLAHRHGREVRHTVDPEGLQRLHGWIEASRRVLIEGRVTAAAQNLSDQRLTSEAQVGAVESAQEAALARPAPESSSLEPEPSSDGRPPPPLCAFKAEAECISAQRSSPADFRFQPTPTVRVQPPLTTTSQAPHAPTRKIVHSLEPGDIRPGDCFRDKSGGLIRITRLDYDEFHHLYRTPGGQIVERRSRRYPLAATLVEAIAPSSF